MTTHSPPTLSASPAPLSPASSTGFQSQSQAGGMPVPSLVPNMAGADPSSGPARRKTSRRANTAERRATHNAVERQRRETLNGRFLDLAALLPNLAAVRRPSKSAIVNSSIALIHTQRRQRAFAGREVRSLKAETDALRREVNEWRERAGVLARIEEPVRSVEFTALMTLEDVSPVEEEEIRRAYEMASIPMGDEDDDGFADGPDSYPPPHVPQQQAPQQQPPQQHQPSHPPHINVPHPHQQLAPPPQQQQHYPQSAPAHMAHHQQIPLEHLVLQQQQQQQRPGSAGMHIPAFDGPSMFPGPGHHHPHGHMGAGLVFGQYNNTSPVVSGSPPHSSHGGHFAPYPPQQPQRHSPPIQHQHYAREAAQFAHVPPTQRDDDHSTTSGSSAGGSPPATGHSQFPSGSPFSPQEVPTLAAGATPADFARFWQTTAPQHQQRGAGFAQQMGFAM